ncbi:lasso peptide biosynthesis PqqD family chaperone [Peribacillus sp. NPDC097295]|uniref:lasso peptide biosynthesis PqqD family chaperone n=1 Tax=Peribacillus sp. NPDC097295 TaxID=3364402 RepID=UPI00382A9E85
MINSSVLSINDVITQNQGNIVSDMDGELVMLSIENGKYYNLGLLGGSIWAFIEKPISISILVDSLMSEYEVSQQECEEEVLAFLGDLYDENLILIVNED